MNDRMSTQQANSGVAVRHRERVQEVKEQREVITIQAVIVNLMSLHKTLLQDDHFLVY